LGWGGVVRLSFCYVRLIPRPLVFVSLRTGAILAAGRILRLDSLLEARPMKMTGYEFSVYRHPPQLGKHTEEVFAEWLKT
jgi:hypothetical protein